MNTMTIDEYKRLRKEYPYNPASQTILWARGNVKPTDLDWDTFAGNHFAVGTGEQDGFRIRVVVDYDEYGSSEVKPTDVNTGIRNPEFGDKWTGDSWDTRNIGRYLSLESDSTVRELAKWYHKAGDSKNVAWERARESLQAEAEGELGEDYVHIVLTAKASLPDVGGTLGDGSIASSLIIDYRGSSLEKDLDNIVSETGIIDEAIEEARENAKVFVAKAADMGLTVNA